MAGISLILQNNPTVTQINCGTSSPKLGGTIDISAFPNLQDFRCINNDVTAISGYAQNSNLRIIQFSRNKVTGSLPSLSALTPLQSFFCQQNLLTGSIPSLSGLTTLLDFRCEANSLSGSIPPLPNSLQFFSCHLNYLTGSIPLLPQNIRIFLCQSQQGNTKLTGSLPSFLGLNFLQDFQAHNNQLTGPIPSLSGLSNLQIFYCFSNQLTGSIPSLSGLNNLRDFRCHINQLTGSIPSLSELSNLEIFICHTNQLTGFDGGSVSNTLGTFRAENNQLTSAAVNAILAAFVAANRTTGTRVLNLGGVGNAAPTGQGITDKATLVSRGWTVTTN